MPRQMTPEAERLLNTRLVEAVSALEYADPVEHPAGFDAAVRAYARFASVDPAAMADAAFARFAQDAGQRLLALRAAKAADEGESAGEARLRWALENVGDATRKAMQARIRDERRRHSEAAPTKITVSGQHHDRLAAMAAASGLTMRELMERLIDAEWNGRRQEPAEAPAPVPPVVAAAPAQAPVDAEAAEPFRTVVEAVTAAPAPEAKPEGRPGGQKAELLYAIRQRPGQTAQELAAAVGGFVQSSLRKLRDEGLVQRVEAPPLPGEQCARALWYPAAA